MDRLIIPLKSGRMLASSGYWCILATVLAAGSLLSAADKGLDSTAGKVTIAFGLLWTIVTGRLAWEAGRRLFSPGLVIDPDGFEFVGKRWRWTDIDALRMVETSDGESRSRRIYVRLRTDDPARRKWVETPVDIQDFTTDGEPLETILRRWLKRYGSGAYVDTDVEDVP